MENKLKKLFDYQKFEGNAKLADLIERSDSRFAQALSDEDLAFVNAAGDFPSPPIEQKPKPEI